MKIGIFYAGKTGTTEHCAQVLSKSLNTALINLEADNFDLNNFDIIIIGSSIRVGRVHPKIKKFLKLYKNTIQEKAYAIFICQGLPNTFSKVMVQNFSKSIRTGAIVIKPFWWRINSRKTKRLSQVND